MPELKILRKCFAAAAIVFACVFATTVPVLLRSPLPHATSRFHAEPVGILLIAMRELIVFMPPFVAALNGIAWWSLRSNRSSARGWSIAACGSFLMMSAPFFAAGLAIMPGTAAFMGVLAFALALSSIGITGIAVFGRYDALAAGRRVESWDISISALRS